MASKGQRSAAVFTVLSALVFLLALAASAKDYRAVEAEGVGPTREAAVQKALSTAIMKVNGASVASSTVSETGVTKGKVTVDGETTQGRAVGSRTRSIAAMSTDGFIKDYEVLSTRERSDGLWAATLAVNVYFYQAPASSNRKKIALTETVNKVSSPRLFGAVSGRALSEQVGRAIEQQLVQSRKFAVLSREDLAAMSRELNLIASGAVNRAEKAKLGQMLGGDFILIPEVFRANARAVTSKVQVTGQNVTTWEGGLTVGLRVINAATGEIKFSDKYSASATKYRSAAALEDAVATKAVSDLVARIYPKRLVKVMAGEVILNAGGDTVSVGSRYKVLKQGERLVDPYTKESLGTTESEVGLIEITRVDSKVSYAKVLWGEELAAGMVARPDASAAAAAGRANKVENRPKKTGVRLPFD